MENKKTVLHIIDSLCRGGAQRVVVNTVNNLPQFNNIIFYLQDFTDLQNEVDPSVKLVFGKYYSMKYLPAVIRRLRKVIKEEKVDLIHANLAGGMMLSFFIGWYTKIKIVHTYHGLEYGRPEENKFIFMDKLLYRTKYNLIATSYAVKQHMDTILRRKRSITVITNSINNEFFNTGYVYQTPAANAPLRIIAVGNNSDFKNFKLIVKAFAFLKDTNIQLDIIGREMEPHIQTCKEQNIANINFLGSISDVYNYLPDYQLFLLASNKGEGCPLSVEEAMAVGLPLLLSDIAPFTEMGDTWNHYFKSDDAEDLAKKIIAINKDRGLLKELSIRNKEKAAHNFTHAIFAGKLNALYNKVLA